MDFDGHLAFLSFSRALLMSSVTSDTLTLAILLHLKTWNKQTNTEMDFPLLDHLFTTIAHSLFGEADGSNA